MARGRACGCGARRGKLAAQVAVGAAQDASTAALATAAAAKAALDAATLAETSASKTAASARLVVEAASADMITADANSALADSDEIEARNAYRQSVAKGDAGEGCNRQLSQELGAGQLRP